MNYKTIIFVLIGIVTFAYPFIIYFSLDAYGASVLAYVLFLILLVRVITRGDFKQPEQFVQLILVGGLCLVAAWLNSEELLRYYPVMMNLAFAGFFAISLTTDKSLVERFGSIFIDNIPPQVGGYMRTLTKVWVGVLVLNSAISFYTACCLSLKAWTLYNGLYAYFFLGGFMLIEFIYRQFYKKRNNIIG